jgi:hypothetical protein
MSEFARQASSYSAGFSIERDAQLRTLLESLFNEAGGSGVISGGGLADNGGVSVLIEPGWYASKGVPLELTAAQTYNGLPSDGESVLWGKVTRTAANPSTRTDLDTYALSVDDTTTGSPPAENAGWFRIGRATTVGGDITALAFEADVVEGAMGLPVTPNVIHSHQAMFIPAGFQHLHYGDLRVDGDLRIDGDLYLLEIS